MPNDTDLRGRDILVVEDSYYLATDVSRALESAGAKVEGPYPTEQAARAVLETRRPDAALIDIDLGDGPSFGLAERLAEAGIPFAFITGCEAGVIPNRFGRIERIEKPARPQAFVRAASRLVQPPAGMPNRAGLRENRTAETSPSPRR